MTISSFPHELARGRRRRRRHRTESLLPVADPWTPELLRAADGFVQLGAAMVRLHLELAELEDATAGFYRNMSDAIAVERAIGVIMHTNDCAEQDARRLLESAARARNVSRREVTEPGATSRAVYLPAGARWTDLHTGAEHAGGQWIDAAAPRHLVPVFTRDGALPELRGFLVP